MTVGELTKLLQRHDPVTNLHICHFAKRAGQAKSMIFPLAELRWLDGRLCLVEEDDRKLYLAEM